MRTPLLSVSCLSAEIRDYPVRNAQVFDCKRPQVWDKFVHSSKSGFVDLAFAVMYHSSAHATS